MKGKRKMEKEKQPEGSVYAPEIAQIMEEQDYNLKCLSESNGMTLLVSEKGQVFWVKRRYIGTPNEDVELIPLNRGKIIRKSYWDKHRL
jgi:hypothetical protein